MVSNNSNIGNDNNRYDNSRIRRNNYMINSHNRIHSKNMS